MGVELDISRFREIHDRIRGNDRASLRDRWEFGRELVARRVGASKLPKGLLAKLQNELTYSRSTMQAWMKFADKYLDEQALSDALDKYPTWHQLVRHGLTDTPQGQTDAVDLTDDDDLHAEEQPSQDSYVRRLLGQAMAVDPAQVQDHGAVADLLNDLLARYEPATAQKKVA